MKEEMKDEVLDIAKLMWERRLSDIAGGNISLRRGDLICITPTLMGYLLRWRVTRKDFSIISLRGEVMEGPNRITREALMHLGLYKEFDDAGAVIHAHPYWTNVFVAKSKPIKPTLQTTEKFGEIGCIEEAHGYSKELADNVVKYCREKRDQWEKTALEVILPRHGIVAVGKDMDACFDIVDRIESDCRCQILGKLLDL
jgi:L-fuculose-phosphate aldolase